MLESGCTTWYEVFDERWSHCHQWSGCPTWILSRYSLGLSPRYDIEKDLFVIDPDFTGFEKISGTLPIYGGGKINVSWAKDANHVNYTIDSDKDIKLKLGEDIHSLSKGKSMTFVLELN